MRSKVAWLMGVLESLRRLHNLGVDESAACDFCICCRVCVGKMGTPGVK